ncbi:MAG: DUF2804 family protein [Caldisericum sp.]|nr:DUF2804 family protein [Caldisericum sp.]
MLGYQHEHLEKEWRIKSSDNKLKLTFKPFMVRLARTNLVLLKSVLYQIFSTYNGSFTRDNGEKIEINNVIGWIEEHNAR